MKGLVAEHFIRPAHHNGKIGNLISSKVFNHPLDHPNGRMGVVLDDGKTWYIRKENLGLVTGPQNPENEAHNPPPPFSCVSHRTPSLPSLLCTTFLSPFLHLPLLASQPKEGANHKKRKKVEAQRARRFAERVKKHDAAIPPVQRKNETAFHFRERVRHFQNRVRPTLDKPRYHRRPPQIRKTTASPPFIPHQQPFYLSPFGSRIYACNIRKASIPLTKLGHEAHKAQYPARYS